MTLRTATAFLAVAAPVFASSERLFGHMPDGRAVYEYTLRNPAGTEAKILSLGATLRAWQVKDRQAKVVDVVLGYDSVDEYLAGHSFIGATIGRYANRIARGEFRLEGSTYHLSRNAGAHTLHGGKNGFDRALWVRDTATDGESVRLRYVSREGEEGFPGELTVWVTYTLTRANELRIEYEAKTSATTVLSLTNHTYFNLGGGGDVSGETVVVAADAYTPVDDTGIPTGAVEPVANTDFDFRRPRSVAEHFRSVRAATAAQRKIYDVNLVLRPGVHAPAASLRDPVTGLTLTVRTTEPAIQLYVPNFSEGSVTGKSQRRYRGNAAICLETQHFPNSPNAPQFPTTVLRPGEMFRSSTVYQLVIGMPDAEAGR